MMYDIEEFPNNPFLPGHPVSNDTFVGRKNDIQKILRYLPRVINQGLPEHFFITGNRGMGRTSFIRYVSRIVENNYDMFPIYINNEGTNTIDELIGKLLEKLVSEFKKTHWGKDFINSFFNRFEEIDIWKVSFKFREHPDIVENVKDNFIEFLVNICSNIDENDGVFIIIDDVNGLSENPEFANWYKSLFETLEFYEEYVPVVFNLVTYPAKFNSLCEQNPSFPRMFNLINIDKLADDDIKYFFKKTFNRFNIEFKNENLLNEIVYYSYGMPLVMQQIGEGIFWSLETNIITEEIVYEGIKNAAYELRNKLLKNTLNKIKNPHYNNILLKLAKNDKLKFQKDEIKQLLNKIEIEVLDEFINQMVFLKIIECLDENYGEYEFVNIAYFAYFLISSTFNSLL